MNIQKIRRHHLNILYFVFVLFYFGVCFCLFFASQPSWKFEHGCLDTCASFVLYACVLYFGVPTCSEQFSMFHMERFSRNRIITMTFTVL